MADAIASEFTRPQRDSDLMRTFGYRLRNQFAVNKVYRRPKELEWLESLRQYKGLYDPEVKLDPNASKVYPKITRSKVNIVLSRLHEMLFPETEKNWEISHTSEPKIARETVKQIAVSLVQQDEETGEAILPTADELNLAIKKYAKTTCERMSSVIDDQLTEMDYKEETKKVLRSGLMYGTGVMKGPLINKRSKRRWVPGAGGEYNEEVNTEDVPFFEFVRLWDFYPDMSVTELDKSEGSFERHLMTKHDLRGLAKRPDFYSEMILSHLEEYPNGDYVPDNWELDLQTIEVEAGQGKAGRTQTAMSAATSEFDQRSSNRQTGKKYQVLSFWGYVDGNDLAACGKEVSDVSLEYAANIWLLGDRPIKAELFEGAIDKYKLFYYEKDETSLFGEGLPRIMRHSQLSISAAARMVLDNGACVAGPQVEVNWSLILPDTDINSFYPRKIWYREGKGVDAQYPAVRDIQFDSHIEELLMIIDAFKQFADEETTLPTWLVGQMVNNETAQATSGRMSTITISIKDVVKNFDTFTEGIIGDLYAWNMEFNPRSDIKGDYSVKARGVSSLVMKEIRMGALTQLTSTLTPEEWDYIPRREFIEEKFKAYDLNIKLRTEEEVQKIRADRENSKQMQLAYAQAEADIAYKKAQTAGQLTKAKKLNVEATKDAQTPIEQPENADPRMNEAELAIKGAEMAGKMGDMRRKEEAHAQKLAHGEDKHQTTKAIDTTKTAQELAINREKAEHERKMKEQTTKASISAKKQAAKVKKSPSATKKPAKKG